MTIERTVIQYAVTPDGKRYWDLEELFAVEEIEEGEGYFSREVDIHMFERKCRPRSAPVFPGWQRVYTGKGKTAHFITASASPNSGVIARCGTGPGNSYWLGTGSQQEIDTLSDKRDCKSCLALFKYDADEADRLYKMAVLRSGRP